MSETSHYCTTCAAYRAEEICPVCLEPAQPVATASAPATGEDPPAPTPPPPPPPPPTPQAASPHAPTPTPPHTGAGAESIIPQARQRELRQYVDDGYEVFLIAGVAGAGKTELLGAYRQDAFLDRIRRREGRALPTPPKHLECLPVHVGGRKAIFVDASGEDLQRLHPKLRPTGVIDEPAIDFLRLSSSRLGGVVLLLHLGRLWSEGEKSEADGLQVEILTWILMLLRWLRAGGRDHDPEGAISFPHHVDAEVRRLRRRLRVPVLVLFSMADELLGVPVPARASGTVGPAGARTLFPPGEDPLMLAHHRLPGLVAALRTHAQHFRFDFVHSLVTDPDTGAVIDGQPWGVSSSLAWLLDDGWRRRLPAIPTRVWLDLQRFLDTALLRNDRWRALPPARDLP